ncbi:MAG: hypothetical protein KGH63_01760 [Candidatus Micrarchaeota archaeon]|nr:hypothetical protein [Candidatus Micrarchaeota archaeon]
MEFYEEIMAVRKPEGELLAGLERAYRSIGEKFGYVMVQSPLTLMLKKSGSQAGFEVQFGNAHEFAQSLGRLAASGCELCFFVTSSRAHTMRLEDARALLLRHYQIQQQRYVFIDIETGRSVKTNFEWDQFTAEVDRPDWSRPGPMPSRPLYRAEPRRKKIRGFRGEHKEQD